MKKLASPSQFKRKAKNARSFKVKENLRARASLEKTALMRKKLKWQFLSKKIPQFYTLSKGMEERNTGASWGSPWTSSTMERLGRNFAISWESKQALKDHYQVKRENQWKSYGRKAKNGEWHSARILKLPQEKLKFLSIWESRLDTCLWKSHLLPSISSARQWIRYGYVKVNGEKVNKSSKILKKGDLVSINLKDTTHPIYSKTLFYQLPTKTPVSLKPQDFSWRLPPQHLEVHYTSFSFVFVENPYALGVENILYPYPLNLSYLPLAKGNN